MHIDEKVWQRHSGLSIAVATIEGIKVKPPMDTHIVLPYSLEELEDMEELKALKSFSWKTGSPSQGFINDMATRVYDGEKLPGDNIVSSICNLAALKYLIPIIAIDLEKLKDSITFRIARKGEKLNGKPLTGRELIAVDSKRILCAFPNQVNEKLKIDQKTKKVLIIGLGVPGVKKEYIVDCMEELYKYLVKECGGHYKGLVLLTR
ncbi:MAG: hypothetical protein J7L23_01615 [Candidatus Diapherotrites archaeon]|nr:hypothetical protein [Candidatus Diapherotrites archaeon]